LEIWVVAVVDSKQLVSLPPQLPITNNGTDRRSPSWSVEGSTPLSSTEHYETTYRAISSTLQNNK
jgi:hypothetical protein